MHRSPPSCWPSYSPDEINAVQAVLISGKVNYWTGELCRNFEDEFARWVGSKFAVSLMNGTVALELALRALGVGHGDEVVVTPRSFIASAACVLNVGATPVFVDVDLDSGNITPEGITMALTTKTKAVICVHLAGWPCDMDPIMSLSREHGFYVIEDCAQAHGAKYRGRSVGNIGHIGAWSFCQDKIMTTGGEGGMVTCNDESLWSRMWAYKDHGKDIELVKRKPSGAGFRWLHGSFGTNWRMLEVQAAIGLIQLGRMSAWTRGRTYNAMILRDAMLPFSGDSGIVRVPSVKCRSCVSSQCECVHAYYKFYAYLKPENLRPGWTRDRVVEEMNSSGVPCFTGSCPEIYLEKSFACTNYRPSSRLPNARKLGDTSLMFLVHPTLTTDELNSAVDSIQRILGMAVK